MCHYCGDRDFLDKVLLVAFQLTVLVVMGAALSEFLIYCNYGQLVPWHMVLGR
jgi:hypothetical protein